MEARKNARRRRLFVDKPFQLRTTLIGIVYIMATAFCLSLPAFYLMRLMRILLATSTGEMAAVYRTHQTYTMLALIGFLIGLIALWTIFTLWRTQRIAGPLVKITRHIHDFSTGNFSDRIRLRSGDYLKSLTDSLNSMADSLEERDRAIRRRIQESLDRRLASGGPGAEMLQHLSADVAKAFEEHSADEPPVADEPASEDLVHSEKP